MKCDLCKSESGDRKLCSVCADAIQRLLHISTQQKHTEVSAETKKAPGAAATAGR